MIIEQFFKSGVENWILYQGEFHETDTKKRSAFKSTRDVIDKILDIN